MGQAHCQVCSWALKAVPVQLRATWHKGLFQLLEERQAVCSQGIFHWNCAHQQFLSGSVGKSWGHGALLLSCPQLNIAKSTWPVLSFQEGPLNFPPTFKFDVGTNKYDSR